MALTVVVSLAVCPPAQPRLGKQALVELTLLAQRDLAIEDIYLARQIFWHFSRKVFFPQCVRSLHNSSAPNKRFPTELP